MVICGGQSVSEWLRMEVCILQFNRRRRSDLVLPFVGVACFWMTTRVVPLYCV